MFNLLSDTEHHETVKRKVKQVWFSDPLTARMAASFVGIGTGLEFIFWTYPHIEPFKLIARAHAIHGIGFLLLALSVTQLGSVFVHWKKIQSYTALAGMATYWGIGTAALLEAGLSLAFAPFLILTLVWGWVYLHSAPGA